MNSGNKAVVLHLYGSVAEAVDHCASVTAFYGEVNDPVKYNSRALIVETTTVFIKFAVYVNYEQAKADLLGGQYSHIYLHVDLPEQVKNHFLSRIRVHGVEYAEPKL